MADARLKQSEFYKANVDHWKFLMQSYESGVAYMQGHNLFSHRREAAEDFAERRKRSIPPGFARAVINTYRSLIARGEVSRQTDNEQFQIFIEEDCDKRGRGLGQFIMEAAFPTSQAVGWTWCLVDTPKFDSPEQEPITLADKLEGNIFPYCVHYDPTYVINWSFDGFGVLQYVTLALPAYVDPVTGKKVPDRVRLYDTEGWYEYSGVNNKLIAEREYDLGRVPFAILYNERSLMDANIGLSAINNIAFLNRDCFNLMSLLQEFLYKQCFNILAVDADLLTDKGKAVIGTSNAWPVNSGGIIPQYISPPADPAQFIMDVIDKDISTIYQEAGLIDRSAQQTAQAQSGISRAFEFHNTNSLLSQKANELERFEQEVADIWFGWEDQENDYVVDYPNDYDIRDLTAELDEAERIFKLPIKSPTMKQVVAKRIVARIVPEADADEEEAIAEEIDSSTFEAAPPAGQVPATGFSALAARFNSAGGTQ